MEQKVWSAYIDIEAKFDQLEGKLTTEIRSIAQKGGQNFTSSFSQALWPLKGMIASVISIGAFVSLSKSIITLADNLEQAKNAFTTMLWSAEQAETMLENLSDFAAKTPFELPEVRQNAKQLLAMGVSAENVIPTMKALGDVASGTGADMSRLAMNFGQVMTQGKLTSRELKDFQVNGVPILDELAKNAGKSKEELQNMITAGQISAEEVARAFETMTSEGWKFADMMATQSSTLTGQWSNFQDQLAQIGERIGNGFLPMLKDGVSALTEMVENNGSDLEMIAGEAWSVITDIVQGAWENIQGVIDLFNTLAEEITEVFGGAEDDSNAATSGITGSWSDFFYYFQQGFTFIFGIVRTISSAIVTVVKWGIEQCSNVIDYLVGSWKSALGTLGSWIMGRSDSVTNSILRVVNKAIEGINGMINLANKIPWVDIGTIDPIKSSSDLKADLENMAKEGQAQMAKASQNAVKDFKNTVGELGDGLVKNSTKVVDTMVKNQTDRIEAIAKKETEANKKRYKEQAKAELDLLKTREKNGEKLTKDEKDKMKRLADYAGELNTKMDYSTFGKGKGWGAGGKGSNKAEKEALKEVKDAYSDIEKKINDHSKALEDAEKKVETLNKKYDELKSTARKAFHEAKQSALELNQELQKNEQEQISSLGERYQEIDQKIKEAKAKLNEEGHARLIEDYTTQDLKRYQDQGRNKLYDVEISKLLEIQSLLEEKALIEKNTTEEQRKAKEFTEQTSKAQEILNKHAEKAKELEEKKASALEKQALAKALSEWRKLESKEQDGELKARYEDETGKMVEITNFKNIQYAQDLFNKSESIRLEKEEVEKKLLRETAATQNLINEKIRLDQEYTKIHNKEIDKQKGKVDELIAKYQALAKAKFGGWGARGARAFGGAVQAGLPYLIGENYKPEMFVPSTSGSVVPVNNYNQSRTYHFSWVTINANNAQDFWSEIQNHIGDYT